ncbi:MarR family winged helix-turn-helix transcriptional regulator [Clostridium sp. MCC353]|uniref:MarR family winged helix-turn-helix transcriptional regulator n=1 Tax=Clostridium sp. MCC353 TaxID=2592646 RepID=UPI001C02DEE4|nr:MarR family winged helix-turn-helix transcriptional regulator [Clostridium sp. MCC353]
MLNPINIIRRSEQSYIRSRVEAHGLHPLDALTLYVLMTRNSCNQDSLCCEMNVDKGRIAKTVSRLEEGGYLVRSVNLHNKREKLLHLTDSGKEMVSVVRQIFDDWNAICFRGFSPEEQAQYNSFLKRIAQNAAESRKELRQHD